jgi:glycosyltransferase involved in cell wall biosynthesis
MLFNWGVDVDRFSPARADRASLRDALGLGPGPVILSPRSLKPLYNPATIVAAFGRVREAVPDAQLVLKHMGTGAEELPGVGRGEGIHVVGHVPYDRMADYYRAADVCVSIASTDSSPRSVWEAMACGCPCVVSDLPWVDELLERDRDALVVPIDEERLADALLRVLGDRPLADSLSERGRVLVTRERNQSLEIDRLAGRYAALAEGRG